MNDTLHITLSPLLCLENQQTVHFSHTMQEGHSQGRDGHVEVRSEVTLSEQRSGKGESVSLKTVQEDLQ